jgi:WD40 repeat protein
MRRLLAGATTYKTGCWLRPVTASFAARQQVIGHLKGHASAALFDPSGLLLTVDSQRWLQFIDVSGGTPPPPVRIGEGEPTGLASDGIVVAIPTREGLICLVDPSSGRRHPLVPSGSGATLAAAFTGPGRLASGGTDGFLRLWEISDDGSADGEIARIDLNDLAVHALLLLDEDRLAVGTDPDPLTRHCIQIWNLRTMSREAAFAGHDWPVTALDTALDGDSGAGLLLAAANDELSAWRLDTPPTCLQRIHCKGTTLHSLAYLNGRVLAADAMGSLRLFSLADGAEIRRLSPHSGLVPSIVADRTRRRFATVSYDQTVRLWDASALEQAAPPGHQRQVTALALTPDGDRLLSASQDGRVLLWNARAGTLTSELGRHDHWVSAVWAGAGDVAITAGWDGMIRFWDLSPGQPPAAIKSKDEHLTRLACSPDGSLAVTASTDGAIRVWDLRSRTEQTMITSPDQDVAAVAIGAAGVRWVTEAGRLYSWSMRAAPVGVDIPGTGRVTACDLRPPGYSSIVGRVGGQLVAFSADGSATAFGEGDCGPTSIVRDAADRILLAAYGEPHMMSDNTARLWVGDDRSSPAGVLLGDVPWTAAALSGDGRHLYLGDESGAVHLIEPVLPGFNPLDPPRDPG